MNSEAILQPAWSTKTLDSFQQILLARTGIWTSMRASEEDISKIVMIEVQAGP